jgi:hypothetical protein
MDLSNLLYDWRYTSIHSILTHDNIYLPKKELFDIFGDKENFIFCHNTSPVISGID